RLKISDNVEIVMSSLHLVPNLKTLIIEDDHYLGSSFFYHPDPVALEQAIKENYNLHHNLQSLIIVSTYRPRDDAPYDVYNPKYDRILWDANFPRMLKVYFPNLQHFVLGNCQFCINNYTNVPLFRQALCHTFGAYSPVSWDVLRQAFGK